MILEFEWDKEKEIINLKKHGVSFEEAKSVFYDYLAKIAFDKEHSIKEERFYIIGFSKNNRILHVTYADNNDVIRIISARKSSKTEKKIYEKSYKNN